MKSEINALIKWVLELADLFDSDEEVKEMLRKKIDGRQYRKYFNLSAVWSDRID